MGCEHDVWLLFYFCATYRWTELRRPKGDRPYEALLVWFCLSPPNKDTRKEVCASWRVRNSSRRRRLFCQWCHFSGISAQFGRPHFYFLPMTGTWLFLSQHNFVFFPFFYPLFLYNPYLLLMSRAPHHRQYFPLKHIISLPQVACLGTLQASANDELSKGALEAAFSHNRWGNYLLLVQLMQEPVFLK